MEKGGFMRIFKLEFQKIMKNPMLWLLAVIFCLVNCLVIYNEAGNKDTSKELVIMHDIIKKTDDINHSRQAKNRNERKQLSEAYQEYYKENIDLYDKLDMTKILKQKEEMLQYHPKGFMKKFVKDNYEHLQKRVEEIKSDKEYNDAFYPGQYYEIHSLLYLKLGKKLIVEMSLLMALSILFIMDYERLQKTNDLVDATRTGKRIMDYKAFTGTLSGILFSAILCSVTWIYFFYCVSFKGLWNVSVASTLVAEKRYSGWFYPFVTFFKMTQIQYLILTLTVYLGIILLIALATIAIQFLLGNSYFSFAILILLNMALFLGAYYSNVTFMNVILRLLNPTNLYITSGAWFMENDITLSFAGNEFWIIGVTGIWMILCVKIARNFKLYDRNVSSIHKNIKKDRCTKNEFH